MGDDTKEDLLSTSMTSDHGVSVYAISGSANFEKTMMALIKEWNPECVVIGEDPTFFSVALALDHPLISDSVYSTALILNCVTRLTNSNIRGTSTSVAWSTEIFSCSFFKNWE